MSISNALKKERDLLFKLLNIVQQEKKALLDDSVEDLNIAVRLKKELKGCIDEAERERISLCGDLKLRDIISGLEGHEKEEAQSAGKDIEEIVYKIKEINNTNQLLIKQSLNYTRLVINLLSPKKVTTYNPSGRVGDANISSSILNKSV